MIAGACLCGAVRYEIDGSLPRLIHCHCSTCRKHHGAPFATIVEVSEVNFRWISGGEPRPRRRGADPGAVLAVRLLRRHAPSDTALSRSGCSQRTTARAVYEYVGFAPDGESKVETRPGYSLVQLRYRRELATP